MSLNLTPILNDPNLPLNQETQRQLALSLWVEPELGEPRPRLNLCLILDHSQSMAGLSLERVKRAAQHLVDRLQPGDQLSVVVFDHIAKVLVRQEVIGDSHKAAVIKAQIDRLQAEGGTAIDKGLQLGLELLAPGQTDRVSQAFLLTDGENEMGDHQRCLLLAQRAARDNITLSTLGFGYHWNPDMLEEIADAARGSLSFIEFPEDVKVAFERLFNRVVSVGLTNAHLRIKLSPGVRLAHYRPIAQVAPDVVELSAQNSRTDHQLSQSEMISVRIGDLLIDTPRTLLINLYLPPMPLGIHPVAQVQVQYDDPAQQRRAVCSSTLLVRANVSQPYEPQLQAQVRQNILALGKYRQVQLAESRLATGDRYGAADLFGLAAQTAQQLGDVTAANILQQSANRLRKGEDLPLSDQRKTRIIAKTRIS